MKQSILFFILSFAIVSGCHAPSSKHKSLIVDADSKYEIRDENKVLGSATTDKDTVRSGIMINDDELRRIWFTKSAFNHDTLQIEIFRTDEVYDHHYLIKIFDGKYVVSYAYQMDGPDLERKVTPTEYLLKLNSRDFRKGKEIRGYTEFKGKCNGEGCYKETGIVIKGNFKFLID